MYRINNWSKEKNLSITWLFPIPMNSIGHWKNPFFVFCLPISVIYQLKDIQVYTCDSLASWPFVLQ